MPTPAAAQPPILSVSQLTRRIKGLLEQEIGRVWLAGEISNWRVSPAGHAYFVLKDEESQIDAVIFKGRLGRLPFKPGNGIEIIARGQVTVYERRGNYQIVCDDLQPKGLGALQLAYEQLKRKLESEGLFDESLKKPLPQFPRRIGIVTSPSGAAIRDILHVLERRFASVHVILYPARVQGAEAAPEIAAGIRALDRFGVDVMIAGRGGGSLEDLWPFNEEMVVRAIHAARTPIISAVGHEVDFTLSDFAADVRAATPSAAAELVVRERRQVQESLARQGLRLSNALSQVLERLGHRLRIAGNAHALRRPEELLREPRQRTDELRMRLENALRLQAEARRNRVIAADRALGLLSPRRQAQRAAERLAALHRALIKAGPAAAAPMRHRLGTLAARLDALSPLAILGRGYALAWKLPGRALVRDARTLAPGDEIELRFGHGAARAAIAAIEEEGSHGGT